MRLPPVTTSPPFSAKPGRRCTGSTEFARRISALVTGYRSRSSKRSGFSCARKTWLTRVILKMVLPHQDGRALEASSLSSSIRVSIAVLLAAVACAADAPKRIISASPNVTEILYGVGAFDRVIAVSDYCTYPPAVKSLPHIGKWQDNNMEQIVSLRPDLLIMSDVQEPLFGPQLRQLGIHIVAAPTRTLDDTFRAIEVIGRATDHEIQARELEIRVRSRLDAV